MELNSGADPDFILQPPQKAAKLGIMPALAGGTAAYQHTLDSALVTLQASGVEAHRIRIRRVGRDARSAGAIAWQSPPAGSDLGPDTLVELQVAGLGFTQALPVGMWDSGGESEMGTREILDCFDDPLEKLKHWFNEGAPLFRLAPDDPDACGRWLRLFGFAPEDWPQELWYRLASLVADLPQLAASEDGCAFVLGVLLGLPVRNFHYRPHFTPLPGTALSRLGGQASRLGVDLLLGDMAEDLAVTVIEVGPVLLEAYERFVETEAGAALMRQVLALVMPLSATHQVSWLVNDPANPPQLGIAEKNARLGVNSHMGKALPVAMEAVLAAGPTALDAASGALKAVWSEG